jgi:multidrug efflux system membrane fusion protein
MGSLILSATAKRITTMQTIRSLRHYRSVLAVAVTIALSGALTGCKTPSTESAATLPAPQIPVAQPLIQRVAIPQQYPARVEAINRVELRPRVSGYVETVHFTEGSIVTAGDRLLTIDARPYRAKLEEAAAALALAESDRELARQEQQRAERLVARKAIAQQELDRRTAALVAAEARVAAAHAARELASLELSFTEVKAPIGGRIGRAEVTPGNLVSASAAGGTLLATLISVDPLYISFDIDEQTASAAGRDGENILPIRFSAGAVEDLEAEIAFLDNELGRGTGTLRLRATVANPNGQLIPGMLGRAVVSLASEETSILIDDKAIGTDQGRRYVLVAGQGARLEYRPIETGPLHGGLRVVTSGLSSDDQVVVNGLMRVRPGVVIEPVPVTMDKAAAGDYTPIAVPTSLVAATE